MNLFKLTLTSFPAILLLLAPTQASAHSISNSDKAFGLFHYLLEPDHILGLTTAVLLTFVILKFIPRLVKIIIPLFTKNKE